MSEIIDIKDLSKIATYAHSISDFSAKYSQAGSQTKRQFSNKLNNSYTDAVNTFIDKLNVLQQQVIEQAPETLNKYSKSVSTFENAVSGEGFITEAQTDTDGKTSLTAKLKGEQLTRFTDVTKALQEALDQAAEALKKNANNVRAKDADIESSLVQLATNRENTHNVIQTAHDDFNSSLGDIISELQTLKGQVNEAQLTLAIPPKSAMRIIAQNKLHYLDAVKTIEDAEALGIVFSDNPEQLMSKDSNKINDQIFSYITIELVDCIRKDNEYRENPELTKKYNGEYLNKFNKIIDEMEKKDFESNKPFLLRFIKHGTYYAEAYLYAMDKYYDDKKEHLQDSQMNLYQNRLNSADAFLGLMASLSVLGVGKHRKYIPNTNPAGFQTSESEEKTIKVELHNLNDIQMGMKVDTYTKTTTTKTHTDVPNYLQVDVREDTVTKNYTSRIYATEDGKQLAINQGILAEIETQRDEATKEFLTDLGKIAAKGTISVVAPAFLPVFEAVDALNQGNGVEFGTSLEDYTGEDVLRSKQYQVTKGGSEAIEKYVKYRQALDELDQKEGKTKETIRDIYLDKGAWVLEEREGGVLSVSSNYQHDFNALLRQREMDNKGVMGIAEKMLVPESGYRIDSSKYYANETYQNAQDIVKSTFAPGINAQADIDPDVQKYLLGQSNLELQDMSSKQLNDLKKAIERLPVEAAGKYGVEAYQVYLHNEYEYKLERQ